MSVAISIRDKRILTVGEVEQLLGPQVAVDARKAGWLVPCAVKENARIRRPFFAMVNVRAAEERIMAGDYPGQGRGVQS